MPTPSNRQRIRLRVLLAALGALAGSASALHADRPLAVAGARVAWQSQVALRAVDTLRGIHLIDEYVFILATDGKVRVIRADNGDHLWSRSLTREGDTLWAPQPVRVEPYDAVLFTRLVDVVLLDLEYGEEIRRLPLRVASIGHAVATPDAVFVNEVNRRLGCYDFEGQFLRWQVMASAGLDLPPLLAREEGIVYFADRGGRVAAARIGDKHEVFTAQIGGTPEGWLAMDAVALYVAASDSLVYALNRRTGEKLWSFRLSAPPVGGPVVTPRSVYQATVGGGVQRLVIDPDAGGNWYLPDARKFLAEWANRSVLLETDGRIALVRPGTGDIVDRVDLGPVRHGVSNPHNDLAIVTTARGHIQCLRPLGAAPLTLDDLRARPLVEPAGDEEDGDSPAAEPDPGP